MTDLITKLRACGRGRPEAYEADVSFPFPVPLSVHDLFDEAADEIERLRKDSVLGHQETKNGRE